MHFFHLVPPIVEVSGMIFIAYGMQLSKQEKQAMAQQA
jgi:hypothetical protein